MKSLFSALTLYALGALLFVQLASAGCVLETSPGQVGSSNPAYVARFGTWVDAYAKTSGDEGVNCQTYRTDIADYPTKYLTEKSSDAFNTYWSDKKVYNDGTANEYELEINAKANVSASISNASVTSTIRRYNSTAYTNAKAEFLDLVKVENLTASPTDVNYIPVTFCSELTSEFTTNGVDSSTVAYGDFSVGSGSPYFCESSFWASKPKFAAKA